MGSPGIIKRGRSSNKKTAQAKRYPSIVVKVKAAEGYAEGDAYKLFYELKDGDDVIEYSEFFLNDTANPRTKEFDDYLAKNNVMIEKFEDLVGLEEFLTLVKQTHNGRRYLNVETREFVNW